jgi:DNA-binding CsgD family transcriptional regulator
VTKQGLSEKEIECLELVATNHTSKEIARSLGVSPHTVDQRMRSAQRKLGVTSRAEAARLFVATTAHNPPSYQPLIYQAPAYQALETFGMNAGSLPSGASSNDQDGRLSVHDSVGVMSSPTQSAGLMQHLASVWIASDVKGVPNTLGSSERTLAIIGIALVSALVFGLLVNGLLGLSSVL